MRVFLLCLIGLMSARLASAAENDCTHTAADFQRHVQQLKRKLPDDGFTVVVTPPFVVIGDGDPSKVKRLAKNTVEWAVEKLKKAYFSRDPDDILDIWLFKDKESYETNAQRLFHTKPDTPYGYYSHADRALIMNIATGGGTLVHEIVHPFVAANFPKCPAWFNEGLGSLYEQCGEEDGQICGYTNWRLPGLQRAIRAKKLPSFETLCSTTTDEFTKRIRARITPRPAISATTFSSTAYCRSSTASFTRTASATRLAMQRSKRFSDATTWRSSRTSGSCTCSSCTFDDTP